MSLTDEIKEYALDLGFCKVGITDAENVDFYQEILNKRKESFLPWINGRLFQSDPKTEMTDCQSVIALAYDYANVHFPEELTRMIGRAYLSRSYVPRADSICGARLQLFEDFLKGKGFKVQQASLNLPLRQFTRKAGVTSFGKNNFSYVDGVGSFVILYAFLVDRVLEYDEPEKMSKCPENCHRCMDACPTGAIVEPFHIEPSRCVGYCNWMRRGKAGSKFDSVVPREIRPLLGTRIHGCDACQEACPRNWKKLQNDAARPKDPLLELIKDHLNLKDILLMDDVYYKKWVYPIMYNYLSDKKYFQRNAAIAIGNAGDESYIPVLAEAILTQDPLVRLHCAWALGRFDGTEAREALTKALQQEEDEDVLKEIRDALSGKFIAEKQE